MTVLSTEAVAQYPSPHKTIAVIGYTPTGSVILSGGRTVSRQRLNQLLSPEATYARQRLNDAIERRIIFRKACESCGRKRTVHGHHDDYSQPLKVRWLCPKCHGKAHRGERRASGLQTYRYRQNPAIAARSAARRAAYLAKLEKTQQMVSERHQARVEEGAMLRALRIRHGITVVALGRALGLKSPSAHIFQMERGESGIGRERWNAIAAYLRHATAHTGTESADSIH